MYSTPATVRKDTCGNGRALGGNSVFEHTTEESIPLPLLLCGEGLELFEGRESVFPDEFRVREEPILKSKTLDEFFPDCVSVVFVVVGAAGLMSSTGSSKDAAFRILS